MKNSVCPTANVTQRPSFSESRIFRSFRIVESTHEMIMVKWHLLNFSKAEFVRIFIACSEVWIEHTTWWLWNDTYSFDTSANDTSANFALWQMRHRFNPRKSVQSTQMGQWLSTLFHANCSAAHFYVLYPRKFIFAPSCRRRPFLQVLQSTER